MDIEADVLQLGSFGKALLFVLGAAIFVALGLGVTRLISPFRPNPEKLTSYECGEDPVGPGLIQLNNRFYIIALVFLIFEVEILFFFPWATVFAHPEYLQAQPFWGWMALVEMVIFVLILLGGLLYVWKKGDLNWIKPAPVIPKTSVPEASSRYEQINQRYSGVKAK